MSECDNLRLSLRAGLPAVRALLDHMGNDPRGPMLDAKVTLAKVAYEDILDAMRGPRAPQGTDGKPLVAPRAWW